MSQCDWQSILQRFETTLTSEALQSLGASGESELHKLEDALAQQNLSAADWILRGLEPASMRLKPSRPALGPTNPADRPVQNEPQVGGAPENEPLRPTLDPERERIRQKLRELAGQS